MSMPQKLKLMIPGPIEVSPEVLVAISQPVQPHYGAPWTAFYNETATILKDLVKTQGSMFIMPGSGSVAIDACLGSAFATGEKILIGINGFFGDRLGTIAESYGIKVVPVIAPWGEALTAEDFINAFSQNPEAKGAAIVHLETSTTILNPIEEIGEEIKKRGGFFFVDAVSSLGGVEIRMDEWGIDFLASASQKCLGAPPGLAPCAVGTHGWEVVDRYNDQPHGWYSNLRTWRKYEKEWGDWHPTPVTMSSNNLAALRVGLDQLLAEGVEKRLARYQQLAMRLREGLRRLGFKLYTPDEKMVPILTAAWAPDGVSSLEILDHLAQNYHIKISSGLGDLREKIFRIGTMSPVVGESDVDEVLDALSTFRK